VEVVTTAGAGPAPVQARTRSGPRQAPLQPPGEVAEELRAVAAHPPGTERGSDCLGRVRVVGPPVRVLRGSGSGLLRRRWHAGEAALEAVQARMAAAHPVG